MTTKTQAVPRSGPLFPIVLVSALAMVALTGAGCTPDIPQEPPPSFVELQFDPSSSPPKSFEPTILVTNQETGLLDFSAAGIVITSDPPDCKTDGDVVSLAACEFYWYLQQLDGFPTLTPGRTPVSAPIDVATVTVPGNLYVQNMMGTAGAVTDFAINYDADEGYLVFDPTAGWDIGGVYAVAIRGYGTGIKDTEGDEAVKSMIYVLLEQDNPLTCGITDATDPNLLNCAFYGLFASDARFKDLPAGEKEATIFATLDQLEQLRTTFKGEGAFPFNLWTLANDNADMPAQDVGILWAFKTHSASVVELNPTKGLLPTTPTGTEVRVQAKGAIQESSLTAFGFANLHGSVFFIDATEFLAPNPDLLKALPSFTPTYDSGTGEIVLTLADALPLVDGHQYILMLTDLVEGKPGKPIVPSPVTVFLRTRGDLVDDFDLCTDPPTATPLVPGIKAPDACQLEAGRQQFKALLDNPDVKGYTTAFGPNGLTREMVTYLYGFVYTAQ